jgi:hypothetical protein
MAQPLRLRGKLPGGTSNASIRARPQRQQQIGMVDDPVGGIQPMHAQHAVVTRMQAEQGRFARQRMHHRTRRHLKQPQEYVLCPGQDHAIPRNNRRTPCTAEEMGNFIYCGFIHRHLTGEKRLMTGRICNAVIATAPCPVLVVPLVQ